MNIDVEEQKPGARRLELDQSFEYPIVDVRNNHDYLVWLSVNYAEGIWENLEYSLKHESFTKGFDYAIKFEINTLILYLVSQFFHFNPIISEVFTDLDRRLIRPLTDNNDGLPDSVWIRFHRYDASTIGMTYESLPSMRRGLETLAKCIKNQILFIGHSSLELTNLEVARSLPSGIGNPTSIVEPFFVQGLIPTGNIYLYGNTLETTCIQMIENCLLLHVGAFLSSFQAICSSQSFSLGTAQGVDELSVNQREEWYRQLKYEHPHIFLRLSSSLDESMMDPVEGLESVCEHEILHFINSHWEAVLEAFSLVDLPIPRLSSRLEFSIFYFHGIRSLGLEKQEGTLYEKMAWRFVQDHWFRIPLIEDFPDWLRHRFHLYAATMSIDNKRKFEIDPNEEEDYAAWQSTGESLSAQIAMQLGDSLFDKRIHSRNIAMLKDEAGIPANSCDVSTCSILGAKLRFDSIVINSLTIYFDDFLNFLRSTSGTSVHDVNFVSRLAIEVAADTKLKVMSEAERIVHEMGINQKILPRIEIATHWIASEAGFEIVDGYLLPIGARHEDKNQ